MELIDHDVANGLWFTKDGVGFPIGNEEGAPMIYLSRYSKRLVIYYPEIIQWVVENPSTGIGAKDPLEWYKRLAEVFIDKGWHLLWRSLLFTDSEVDQVAKDLRNVPNEFKTDVNLWPPNTKIDVHRGWAGEKVGEVGWDALNR